VEERGSSDADPREWFPEAGEVPGWSPADDPAAYSGEDLFVYIDGGADLFLEYGFERALVREYASDDGARIGIEIYEMSDPEAVCGIFSMRRSPEGETLAIGDEASVEEYYLNFRKGRCLVTLTALDGDGDEREALVALARDVAGRIPGSVERPALLERIEIEGRKPGSARYLAGPLGLFNTCSLLPRQGFRFEGGASVELEDGSLVLLFRFADAAARERMGGRLRDALERDPRFEELEGDSDRFTALAGGERGVRVEGVGELLLVVVGAADPVVLATVADRARPRLGAR
jgi:hypothetical protein